MSKNQQQYRKNYIEKYGPIPNGYHIHHKIPVHNGGTDDVDNLVCLTVEDHAKAHLELFIKFDDFRDLCSYHLLSGHDEVAHKIACSNGGKIGGNVVKETQVGILDPKYFDNGNRTTWASMGGKAGSSIQIEQKIGIHGMPERDPELHKKWASMGGKASGQFQSKEFQAEMGRRGGPKNKGFKWLTNETREMKYTMKMQKDKPIIEFLSENAGWRLGKKKRPKKECIHCFREFDPMNYKKSHGDKCKMKGNIK